MFVQISAAQLGQIYGGQYFIRNNRRSVRIYLRRVSHDRILRPGFRLIVMNMGLQVLYGNGWTKESIRTLYTASHTAIHASLTKP